MAAYFRAAPQRLVLAGCPKYISGILCAVAQARKLTSRHGIPDYVVACIKKVARSFEGGETNADGILCVDRKRDRATRRWGKIINLSPSKLQWGKVPSFIRPFEVAM